MRFRCPSAALFFADVPLFWYAFLERQALAEIERRARPRGQAAKAPDRNSGTPGSTPGGG